MDLKINLKYEKEQKIKNTSKAKHPQILWPHAIQNKFAIKVLLQKN